MKKNRLGTSDLFVSELGLGCMSLGNDGGAIINAALEEGITYFDTADLYEFGANEKQVGKSLKAVREDVVIATKVGNNWNTNQDGWTWDPSKSYIKSAVKDSLKRLGLDYIDLYQLHGGTIEDPIEEIIETFEELKAEGLIRCYGISSIRPNVIREYAKRSSIASVMLQYSLLDRRPEEEILSLLEQHSISTVTRGPLAKGLLSKSWQEKFEKVKDKGFLDYSADELHAVLEVIEKLLANKHSMNGVAFQYILRQQTVASVVAGASSVKQLRDNARAVKEATLTEEEFQLLQEITKKTGYTEHQ